MTPALTGSVIKTYDGTVLATLSAGNYTLSGVQSQDQGSVTLTVNGVPVTSPTTGVFSTKNVNPVSNGSTVPLLVTVSGLGLDEPGTGSYILTSTTVSADIGFINPASLTITATADSKVYDGTRNSSATPTFQVANEPVNTLYGSDTLTGLTQTFASKDALGSGNSLLGTAPGYTLTDGNGGANYTLSFHTTPGTITPAALSVTATSDTKVYDGTRSSSATPAFQVANEPVNTLYGSDTLTGLTETFASKDVLGSGNSLLGTAPGFTLSDGNGGADYTLSFHTAAGTITPAALSITPTTDTRVYDGTRNSSATPSFQVANEPVNTLYGGDTLAGLTQTFASKDVLGSGISLLGTAPGFTLSDGNAGGDYTLSFHTAAGTITPAALSITATTDTRVYDGTRNSSATPTFQVSGLAANTLYGSDTLTGLTQTFASKDALGSGNSLLGTAPGYTLSDGNGGANYMLSFHTAPGTITPAALSVTAAADTKVYDGTRNSSATPSFQVANEPVNTAYGSDTLTGLTQTFASKDVLGPGNSMLGTAPGYTLNDGNGGADYSISFHTAPGTITPAALTISAVGDSRVYNGTTFSSGAPVVGTVYNSDTVTGLSQAFTSKDVLGTNGSTLSVTGYKINDGNSGKDYSVTLQTAAGTIAPAPLTISAVSDSRVYNGTTSPSQTPTVSGLFAVGGDTVTGLSQAFTSKDVLGTNGSTLIVSGYTVNDGNGGADYSVTTHSAAGTITPAALTISAVSDSRVYNGTKSSAGTPTVSGLITGGGDTVTGLTQAFGSKDVLGTNGSTLAVTGYSVNDGNAGKDYSVALQTAFGTMTPAALTITAASQTKDYDGTTGSASLDPYSGAVLGKVSPAITSGQIYGSDKISLSELFNSPNAGAAGAAILIPSAIIQDGNGGKDYSVAPVNAFGTINRRPLALTGTRAYDGTTNASAGILTMANLAAGDMVTLSGTGVLTGTGLTNQNQTPGFASIGTLAISGASAANYTLANITTPVALGSQLLNTVYISFSGVSLSGNLQGENFSGLNLTGVNLSGANLKGAMFNGTNLTNANLSGVNLMGDSLAGANLTGANLSGSNLKGDNLAGADLMNADLFNVNLMNSNLTGAILTGANLTGANLHGAIR